jgi:hypothetical protein
MPPEPLSQTTSEVDQRPSFLQKISGKVYLLLLLILLVIIGAYYVGAIDRECLGFTHDDGVYAVAGKSLAMGKGFKLLHVVGEPAQIKYPFGYPLILALVWLIQPQFPQNLPAMAYITIAFTLASCWLIFVWLKQCQKFPGWLALSITAIIPSNFFFLYFFGAIMSEAPYLFFSLWVLWLIHQASLKEKPLSGKTLITLIALSSLSFLTRVLGVALMGAVGVWLLLNRQWKNALTYAIGCLFTGILPWVLWIKLNTPTINPFNYPLVNAYSNYGLEFFHNLTTANYANSLGIALFSLINKMQEVMIPVLPNLLKIYPALAKNPDIVNITSMGALTLSYLMFGYFLLQGISALRKSWVKGQFQAQTFSVPGLYLFFYLLIITLWNYEDQMSRFLTPVLPLLWFYFFKPFSRYLPELGYKLATPRWKVVLASAITVLICVLALCHIEGSYRTIWISRNKHWVESGKYPWLWDEYKATFQWINTHLPKDAKLSVASDVVFYLYTERPTFYTFYASLRRKNGKFTKDSIPLLMQGLDHYGVNYLVAEPHMQFRSIRFPVNLVAKQLMDLYPRRFQHIYGTPRGSIHIYKILPLAKSAKH